MPIYAFECAACGHHFDRLQKIADPDPQSCPECEQPDVRRQLTAPSFRLAGSGWYETDFKNKSDKKRNLAGNSDSTSAASTATESKPSTSSDTASTENSTKNAE